MNIMFIPGGQRSCSVILCLMALRQGVSLNLELGVLPESPSGLPVSTYSTAVEHRHMKKQPEFYVGPTDLNPEPITSLANTLIHCPAEKCLYSTTFVSGIFSTSGDVGLALCIS